MQTPIFRAIGCVILAALTGCGRELETPPPERSTRPWSGKVDVWADHMQGLPFIIGYEKGLKEARAQGKPALVFVTTTWCSWCKRLSGEAFQDPSVRKLLENFVLILVDGDVEKEALNTLDVDGYPHIVFVSPAGQKLGETIGYKPTAEFKRAVESAWTAFAANQERERTSG